MVTELQKPQRYRVRLIYVWCLTFYTSCAAIVFFVAYFRGDVRQIEGAYVPGILVGLALSLVLTHRRPENRIGPLLATIAASLMSLGLSNVMKPAMDEAGSSTGLIASQLLADFGFGGMFLCTLVLLPLWFPTGYALTRRWAWVGRLAIAVSLVSGVTLLLANPVCVYVEVGTNTCTFFESPWGLEGFSGLEELLYVPILAAPFAIASSVLRWRRAQGVERQQMKWFPIAAVSFLAAFISSSDFIDASLWVVDLLYGVALLAVFGSIAIAVLRYRLYDIDRFVSRTVTYAVVVGLLTGLAALLATVVGVQFDRPLVVAATTLAVAAAFNPLRRRVQRLVDRRFNRSRYDAERVMDEFARSLRDEVDEKAVLDGLNGVVSETMHPSALGVWVR